MALQDELKTQGDFLFKNRSYLPLFFLVMGLGAFLYDEYMDTGEMMREMFLNYYKLFCLSISLFGLLIRGLTVGYTPKDTSGRNTNAGQVAAEINTTGMYSLLRHPLYLGNFFMWLGLALLTENLWFTVAFILLYWLYYERIMYAEETFLITKFGDIYLDWAEVTPAFLPFFKSYKKPKYSFCIKKVLKKEKNGFAAIFLLFWLFDWTGSIAQQRNINFEFNFWFYAAIGSSITYFILKVMKKRKLLPETNS
ncbi:lipid A phosphate methyltransferase [Salegentibacter echinorum]|uniref:Lipid A phosphate methyltransferase n=1 Tax=Salegentibacter echinorum TaxID=1073325 RepID=A0A1M5K287_SALEC|nr:isoprenylcysteine carboxylmethyltransferase family protein [Salegentibacter echinorum]SHG46835.1 lipid A phosphate methyltransferase [Salegentibacter echinorum]